jgi:hypothetical protein
MAFQHDHVATEVGERAGRGKAHDAGTDDDDLSIHLGAHPIRWLRSP